jgi:hypothetical protein
MLLRFLLFDSDVALVKKISQATLLRYLAFSGDELVRMQMKFHLHFCKSNLARTAFFFACSILTLYSSSEEDITKFNLFRSRKTEGDSAGSRLSSEIKIPEAHRSSSPTPGSPTSSGPLVVLGSPGNGSSSEDQKSEKPAADRKLPPSARRALWGSRRAASMVNVKDPEEEGYVSRPLIGTDRTASQKQSWKRRLKRKRRDRGPIQGRNQVARRPPQLCCFSLSLQKFSALILRRFPAALSLQSSKCAANT